MSDDRETARLYKVAADQGHALARCSLGIFYAEGRGGLPKDDRAAARPMVCDTIWEREE